MFSLPFVSGAPEDFETPQKTDMTKIYFSHYSRRECSVDGANMVIYLPIGILLGLQSGLKNEFRTSFSWYWETDKEKKCFRWLRIDPFSLLSFEAGVPPAPQGGGPRPYCSVLGSA